MFLVLLISSIMVSCTALLIALNFGCKRMRPLAGESTLQTALHFSTPVHVQVMNVHYPQEEAR